MTAIIADNALCTGCQTCQLYCSIFHVEAFNPKRARVLIHREEKSGQNTVIICRQCKKPPCKASCDRDAILYNELRVLTVDSEKCNGCGACISACPFNVIRLDPINQSALICDLCTNRGRIDPQCIGVCVVNALTLKGVE